MINLHKTEQPNHSDISSVLLKSAKTEDDNNENELVVCYKFVSEQIAMINIKFNKRVYPDDSFTIAYGLLLHNNSTRRMKKSRKAFLSSFFLTKERIEK